MILTTITPYWGRPEMLRIWLKAVAGATHSDVCHIVFFAGDPIPSWAMKLDNVQYVGVQIGNTYPSIGQFHNMGAVMANTEWMMKLDVDALPNVEYFSALLKVLEKAKPRDWFNGGMLYTNQSAASVFLNRARMPLQLSVYQEILSSISRYGTGCLSASNFICRREEYLALGGCDTRFQGWGWEDYQQLYMLERYKRGSDPLPGEVTLQNVTRRCRDEISRPVAQLLFDRDPRLALLHHWHPTNTNRAYRDQQRADRNRQVLFDYISKARQTV